MKRLLLFISAFSALSAVNLPAATNILFLAGPRSHASGDHEFNAGCLLLAKALNEQSGLDVQATVISGWPKDESVFDDVDAVIIYSDSTKVVRYGWEKTDQLAKAGVGLMFMHYAVHPSPEEGEKYFRPWIGAAMESGYSVNPHWVADLKTLPNHPISNGIDGPIRAYDEFYYHMRFQKDRAKVLDLVTAVPTRDRLKRVINMWNQNGVDGIGKKQTLMWGIERPGGGRGVGFTGGHYHRNWAIDGFRKIVLNAIVWVAGMDVPQTGVKSTPLTEDDINANLDIYEGKENPRIPLPDVEEFMQLPPATNVTMKDYEAAKKAPKKKTKPSSATNEKTKQRDNETTSAALYTSPTLKSGDKQRLHTLDVKLDKAADLYLTVSDEGNKSHDWSNWIDPVITFEDGSTQSLTKLEWQSAKSTGTTHINKNYNGKGPLKVDGKIYKTGIGTHAPSIIHYQLPKPAVRLTGRVALDDGGAIRGGKSTPAEVRFAVYTSLPLPPAPTGLRVGGKEPAKFFDPNSLKPQKVPLSAFELPDDLEATVWATSPMLFNPTNMDTDASGRIWVTEGVNYRRHAGRRPEGDRVVVLQDTTGDGRADSTHTFVQDPELEAPLGIAVLDNKIIVSQPPSLIVYTDVDRDLRFDPERDKREVLLTGFNGRQHDHSLHAVVAGPDGKFYLSQGNTGAKFTTNDGMTYRIGGPYQGGGGTYYHDNIELGGQKSDDGRIYTGGFAARMNPDGTGLRIIGHGFRNSYENTLTSFGDVFQNDNDDPPACRTTWLMEGGFLGFFSRDGKRTWRADMRPGQSIAQAEWRQGDPGTLPPGDVYGAGSPTGIAFYENGALPEKYQGLLLSCEARVQSVFGYYPKPDGAGYDLGERFDFFKAVEGNLFRPSDVMVGADGAIYVADWFDPGVGGHGDKDESLSGTIYRIAPKNFQPKIAEIQRNAKGALNTESAATLLASPSPNVRYAGFEALKASGPQLLGHLELLLNDANPYLRARAAWLLPFAGDAGVIAVNELLASPDPQDRILAFRALRNAGEQYLDDVTMTLLAEDPSPAVRRELAVSLRHVPAKKKTQWVAKLCARMPENDRTYLEACGLAAEGAEAAVWKDLHSRLESKDPLTWPDTFAALTWRLQPPAAIPALAQRATSNQLTPEQQQRALDTIAFTRHRKAANAMAEIAASSNPAAIRWLLNRAWGEWETFGTQDKLKEMGLYDPDNNTIIEMAVPEPPKESSLPSIAEIAKLKGDPAAGKTAVAACYACHQIEGQGIAYGPDLKNWVMDQGLETFIEALVNPSATIALGYDGSSIRLKKGGSIHGLAYSQSNPVIVQSMGGLTQIISGNNVEKVAPLKRSLMLSADQLGLTPQMIADIAAYLKTYK